jgi:hypothetical protein
MKELCHLFNTGHQGNSQANLPPCRCTVCYSTWGMCGKSYPLETARSTTVPLSSGWYGFGKNS